MTPQEHELSKGSLQRGLEEGWNRLTLRMQRLSPRDRHALMLLSAFAGVLFVIYGVILPSLRLHEQNRQHFEEQRALLHWLTAQQPAVLALSTNAAKPATEVQNPLTLVNTAAQNFDLKITRLQPENNGNLRVWMEHVSFNNTLRWLQQLQSQGLVVKEIMVDRQHEGTVNVRVVF